MDYTTRDRRNNRETITDKVKQKYGEAIERNKDKIEVIE